jgi:DNA-binding transcriptional regulator YhcF (GntR family)
VILSVDPSLPMPAYEQMREQITRMIVAGTLPVGARLPTIRQLAADLGLAKGTVARAYELLESESAIETHGRKGTFVAQPPRVPPRDRRRELAGAAEAAVIAARQLGVTEAELVEAVHRAWARF